MKLKKLFILGLAISLLGFAWSCDDDDDETPTTGTISGTVTDANSSAAIAGATVALASTSYSTNTATDGSYTLSDVEEGTYTLNITAIGYQAFTQSSVNVSGGGSTTVNAGMTAVQGGADAASQAVSSEQEATIETPAGAALYIPEGAVPHQEDGSSSTMVFSIESDESYAATPPSGEQMATAVYRFGPEGFTFERKVTVEIPIPDDVDLTDKEVRLYRVNPTTGENEYYTGSYNRDDRTIYAQTYHFSPWFATWTDVDPEGHGCAWVQNNSDKWVGLCVVEYELDYPERDQPYMPAGGWNSYWAPWNHNIGVTNEGEWWLPQGTYTVCITYSHDAGLSHVHRNASTQLVIDNAAHGTWTNLQNWDCTEFNVGGENGSELDGRCDCTPIPTIPVGTGDIQVTLTWWNENALDLDLWVTDPTGERCWYSNGQAPEFTSTGGQLDRDNLCSNYENGRPENIYWTTNPPAGEYIVEVNWYDGCGENDSPQSINVRTVVQGVTNTYQSSVGVDETIEVCRFTVAGSGVIYSDGRGKVDRSDVVRPAKN